VRKVHDIELDGHTGPDEIIDAITPYVQYAPTEPGAPLRDEEWQILMSSVSNLNRNSRPVIDAILAARRAHIKAKPKTLQDRIEERFARQRDSEDSYTPDALAVIAMEEINRTRNE
jgi:hypothetical protein